LRISGLKHIGGPHAISLRIWLWLSPLAILGTVFSFPSTLREQHLFELIGASLAAYIFSGSLFLLARYSYLRPREATAGRALLAIMTYALNGLAIGLAVTWLIDIWTLQSDLQYLTRGCSRALLNVFWSAIITLALDSSLSFRSEEAALRRQIADHAKVLEVRKVAAENLRFDLVTSLRRLLETSLNSADPAQINKVADSVVRPVSRRIWEQALNSLPTPDSQPPQVSVWPTLRLALIKPPQPFLLGAIASLGLTLHALPWLEPLAFINAFSVGVLVAICGWVMAQPKPQALFLNFITLVLGALASSALGSFFQKELDVSIFSFSNVNLGSWVIAAFFGAYLALDKVRKSNIIELEAFVQLYEWSLDKLKQELWAESRRMSRIVHGDIQSRLRAAAQRTSELSKEELESLREACIAAISFNGDDLQVDQFLEQSKRLWADSMSIVIDFGNLEEVNLEADRNAREALVEVLREGFCNAARHSTTDEVQVKLKATRDVQGPMLEVEVLNRGELGFNGITAGLGSEIIDEIAGNWSLSEQAGWVRLKVSLPLSPESFEE
jgi:hypothetical protein